MPVGQAGHGPAPQDCRCSNSIDFRLVTHNAADYEVTAPPKPELPIWTNLLVLSCEGTKAIKKTRSIFSEMALAAEAKLQVVAKYKLHKTDVGSPEVQVAILSTRILQLQDHFKAHKKDHHSRRGLLSMVARRRRLLKYLKSRNPERYKSLIQSLGIRR
jgi:small subunit ribosomal protein S15